MLIKSKVKYIQSLSQKKLRDEEGVFVAEGPKIVEDLIRSANAVVVEIFATKEWIADSIELLNGINGLINQIDKPTLERISFLSTPNQVLGIFRKPPFDDHRNFKGKISLMLDTIQDPGNMGTIIRCADWFGIQYIICSRECADAFSPKVVQATMGSISRVQVIYSDLLPFIEEHQIIPVYATTLKGDSVYELSPVTEGFILFGNESKGIDETIFKKAKFHITIPKAGKAESLNAAVAAGIILSALSYRL